MMDAVVLTAESARSQTRKLEPTMTLTAGLLGAGRKKTVERKRKNGERVPSEFPATHRSSACLLYARYRDVKTRASSIGPWQY
jgi:hypothetical protein